MGDVVVHDGGVYQALRDTGKEPGHADWLLLAPAGRDGCDGLTPNACGTFDAYKTRASTSSNSTAAATSRPVI
jgi:hypothetical protein